MQRPIERLTTSAFESFGKVIEQPLPERDASGPGWAWWAEQALLSGDSRPYAVGYLALEPAQLRFDWAERHMESMELLIPTGDCLVYVGPPDFPEEPDHLPPLDTFRVFQVRRGQAVLIDKGVWHGAPLALDEPLNVFVLLLQKTGDLDTSLVRFTDRPVEIERRPGI